jgi:hypothetical protein
MKALRSSETSEIDNRPPPPSDATTYLKNAVLIHTAVKNKRLAKKSALENAMPSSACLSPFKYPNKLNDFHKTQYKHTNDTKGNINAVLFIPPKQ